MSQGPMIQAMVWYKKEDWDTLMKIFTDSHLIPQPYEAWLEKAEEMAAKVQAQGDKVVKVYIDPETFPEWCKSKGRETNAEARADLAIEVVNAQNFTL